jgi:nucleoside recognition membrane protein YjiH
VKKGWKIIMAIFLIVVVIGVVSIGVGMLTGAEYTRIYSVLDDQYHIDMWINYFSEVAAALQAA